jgi:hypothetical protein
VRHDRAVPSPGSAPSAAPPAGADPTVRCPGCGSVLAPGPEDVAAGDSAACRRLFEETLRGLREDAAADPRAAAVVELADDAYAAQHAAAGEQPLATALAGLAARLDEPAAPVTGAPPPRWRTTVADVAADLDVIDLSVLVDAWARAVLADWSRA